MTIGKPKGVVYGTGVRKRMESLPVGLYVELVSATRKSRKTLTENANYMVLQWSCHGCPWSWNGSAMVMEWSWNGRGMVVPWSWNGSAMVMSWSCHGRHARGRTPALNKVQYRFFFDPFFGIASMENRERGREAVSDALKEWPGKVPSVGN